MALGLSVIALAVVCAQAALFEAHSCRYALAPTLLRAMAQVADTGPVPLTLAAWDAHLDGLAHAHGCDVDPTRLPGELVPSGGRLVRVLRDKSGVVYARPSCAGAGREGPVSRPAPARARGAASSSSSDYYALQPILGGDLMQLTGMDHCFMPAFCAAPPPPVPVGVLVSGLGNCAISDVQLFAAMMASHLPSTCGSDLSRVCREAHPTSLTEEELTADVELLVALADVNVTGYEFSEPFCSSMTDAITAAADDGILVFSVSEPARCETTDAQALFDLAALRFAEAGARGTLVVASGDSGPADLGYPQASPYVVSVGASIDSGEGFRSGGGVAAATGAASYRYAGADLRDEVALLNYLARRGCAIPPEQPPIPNPPIPNPQTVRTMPDLVGPGQNVQIVLRGTPQLFSGTSAAAPITASIVARMIQLAALATGHSLAGLGQQRPTLRWPETGDATAGMSARDVLVTLGGMDVGSNGDGPAGFNYTGGSLSWDPIAGVGRLAVTAASASLVCPGGVKIG